MTCLTKKSKEISSLDLSNQKGMMDFLRAPTVKIAEFITGVLVSEQKDWKFSAGKLVQAAIKGNLLTQLGREIEKYRNEGRIKEDYFATHKNQASLYELLKFLDEEVPDEELFKAIKSIFFAGISVDSDAQNEALAYEFLQTAKKLNGTEILILKANFDIVRGHPIAEVQKRMEDTSNNHNRGRWRKFISIQMGYSDFDAVVRKYEAHLEELCLITPRNEDNRFVNDYEPSQKFRLTEIGFKFCEFMTKYE
ncbi:MAG: hypothetical protein WC798_02305 [Candidatus Paceibacterota bacterium]|jgi:hypothetical protein